MNRFIFYKTSGLKNFFLRQMKIPAPAASELRWKNVRRIYYALKREDEQVIIILIGGSKNAQKKEIGQARKILRRTSI